MLIMQKIFAMALPICLTLAISFSSSIPSAGSSRVTRSNQLIDHHLPRNILPISYQIMLNPDFDNEQFTFYGESKIDIRIKDSTNSITMHARKLDIKSNVSIECDHTTDVKVLNIEPIDPTTDFLKIILTKELQTGSRCNLTLKYTGKGHEDYKNLYRVSYKAANGEKRWLVSTSFLLSDARNVFPCWDEPAIKANFTLSVEHSKNYVVLSNMPVTKQEISSSDLNRKITHFAESPRMHAGSVTFTIGDYATVELNDQGFRVWAPRHLIGQGTYALKMGRKLLKGLEDYLDFSCKDQGIAKVDSIAVPIISGYNADSNWGLISYQRWGLLLNETSSTTTKKEFVTKVIAHELAHQWFGSLISSYSIDYTWIIEGFANYFQYTIPDQIEPSWHMMDRYVLENMQSRAFIHDSGTNTHAMEAKFEKFNGRIQAHNRIIYHKSGAIIRMISHVLGEAKFKSGLRNFLKAKAYTAVTSGDLFEEFAKVDTTNTNLLKILKNWVTVPGYPVITVTRNYELGKATITQSRFLKEKSRPHNEAYWIPINFVTENNMNFADTSVTHWFDPAKDFIEIDGLENNQFVIFNKQQFGYYRVNYDAKNWELITNYLNTEKYTNIHVLNRAQLMDDALNLAKAGYLKYNIVLSLIGYLEKETDFIPWSTAWKVIDEMYNIVENTELEDQFKDYVVELSEKVVEGVLYVQLNQVDYTTKLKKLKALERACTYGSHLCRSEATKNLLKWVEDPKTNVLSPDDRKWLICAGIRDAGQNTWDKLYEKYRETPSPEILLALACPADSNISKRFLSKATTYSHLQLYFMFLYEKNANSANAILEFMIEHYDAITALDGYNSRHLQQDLATLGTKLTNQEQYEKLMQFIKNNRVSLNGVADEALKSVENNLKAVKNVRLIEFEEFFKRNQPINQVHLSNLDEKNKSIMTSGKLNENESMQISN